MKTICISEDASIMNKLVHANQVIDKFISSCSHSMRGPLKTIRGLVNLISDGEPTEAASHNQVLELIRKTTTQMEHILSELEQFLENSTRELKVDEVDIVEVVNDLRARFSEELEERSIQISFRVNKTAVLITDKERLNTILFHILSNAISFYDPSKERRVIFIEARIFSSSYEISIQDNGIGIAQNYLKKIFQVFFKGTEKSKGAGIGLYIVKEIVQKMKGLVSVQSQINTGSNFLVWLPNHS